ncbi:MAG: tetratricopeptide repeat protein, partial [Thermoanaerobaculia bacterium]
PLPGNRYAIPTATAAPTAPTTTGQDTGQSSCRRPDRIVDAGQPAESDPEDRRKLAALGYLGGFAGSVEGPLPDPKSRLASLDALRQAIDAYQRDDFEQTIVVLRAVVAEEPRLVDAWEYLGHSFLRTGRLQDALQAYRQGLDASGGSPYLAAEVAGVLLKLGRLDEAHAHAELAVRGHEAAYDLLAQIAMREGDLEEAEHHVERAVAGRGGRVAPLLTQADLLLRQDDPEEALAVTDQVLAEAGSAVDPDAPQGLHLIRGKAYARMGEAAQAEESFLRELEVSSRELAPYTHLALLYAVQDRAADAGRTLGRMVEANPTPTAYAEAVRTLRLIGDPRAAAAVLQQALRRWPESRELRELAG